VNKKDLTEADIRTKFITHAVAASGWDLMTQLCEEAYFTKGRVMVRGKTVARGEANKADYLLFYKPNLPNAVIKAKASSCTTREPIRAPIRATLPYCAAVVADGALWGRPNWWSRARLRSSTFTVSRTFAGSMPIDSICWCRPSLDCSRVMYSDLVPLVRAFW